MANDETKQEDTRPPYTAPRVIRLDDANSGVGACGGGNSPAGGVFCIPSGNGATIQSCGRGNGAKGGCFPGNGV